MSVEQKGKRLNPNDGRGPIVHFLYEPGAGGLDRVAILLANGMARKGLKTELWLTKTEGALSGLISDQVTVRKVPTPRFGGRGLQLFLQIPQVAKMIRTFRPLAIFSAGNQSNLSIALAKKFAGPSDTKIIQKITNPVVRPGPDHRFARLREIRFEKTSLMGDATLSLSQADAIELKRLMPSAEHRIFPIRNAYVSDLMLEKGQDRAGKQVGGPIRLLSVGRLTEQKDHATLFRALGLLVGLDWTLDMLGDGELLPDLKRQADELGIANRIMYHGFVDDPVEFYLASDVLVLSSRWEGLPAVPLEAIALGCAVVATDCSPGLTEILAENGNMTVPIGDANALAEAIKYAINKPCWAKANSAAAASFSVDSSVEDHLRILNNLIGMRAGDEL